MPLSTRFAGLPRPDHPLILGADTARRAAWRQVIGGQIDQAAGAARDVAAAHRALTADPNVQFALQPVPPPKPPPAWLTDLGRVLKKVFGPVGRFFDWLGSFLPDAPYARILLWLVLLAAGIALGLALFERLRHGSWRRWNFTECL